MAFWNRNKKQTSDTFLYFKLVYLDDMVYGVTAESQREAEEIVCEEIFHNQTIPGFPKIYEMTLAEVKKDFKNIDLKKLKNRGIWHSKKQ